LRWIYCFTTYQILAAFFQIAQARERRRSPWHRSVSFMPAYALSKHCGRRALSYVINDNHSVGCRDNSPPLLPRRAPFARCATIFTRAHALPHYAFTPHYTTPHYARCIPTRTHRTHHRARGFLCPSAYATATAGSSRWQHCSPGGESLDACSDYRSFSRCGPKPPYACGVNAVVRGASLHTQGMRRQEESTRTLPTYHHPLPHPTAFTPPYTQPHYWTVKAVNAAHELLP